MSADIIKQLDDLLLANYVHLATERELDTEAWLAHLQRRYPEPSFFAFAARRDWRAAFAEVARVPVVRREIDAVFVPVWICGHQEESPNDEWIAETMVVTADGKHQRCDEHVAEGRVFGARIVHGQRAYVAPSRSYCASVPHLLYNASHIVLSSDGAERVVAVYGSAAARPVPRPTREVPPWTDDAAAAVELTGLDALWASMITAPSEGYRSHAPSPDWPSLIEAALASERGGPPEDEE